MKLAAFKFEPIDPQLKKSSVIFFLAYMISNLICFSINLITPSSFPQNIQRFDTITTFSALLFLLLFLFKRLNLQRSTFFFSVLLTADLIISDHYAIFNCMSGWEYIIFRDAFVLSISLIVTGFICGRKTIIVQSLFYQLMLIAAIVFHRQKEFSVDIFIFLMMLVLGFSFAVIIYKQNMEKILKQKFLLQRKVNLRDKEIHQKEIELTKNKSAHLKEMLQQKDRELTSHALLISRYNERDKMLQKKLQEIINLRKNKLLEKVQEINTELSETGDSMSWRKFQKRFELVHPDFYKKLASNFPALSPSEQKLSTFIRLGLTSKEIASLTYNTKESVDVARSRLRKKLQLKRSENMEAFLLAL